MGAVTTRVNSIGFVAQFLGFSEVPLGFFGFTHLLISKAPVVITFACLWLESNGLAVVLDRLPV